jgi:Family of unknown function (DUF6152)
MKFNHTLPTSLTRCGWGTGLALLALFLAAISLSTVAGAHHSFAMFDFDKTVSIDGTVKDFQWTNPHVWIDVIVESPDGPKQYGVEGFAIPVLKGAGWTFNTLKPGDKVTIVLNPLRSGALGGSLVSAKLPDGKTLGTSRRTQ